MAHRLPARPTRQARGLAGIAVLAAVALLAVACGDDDDPAAAPDRPGSAPTTPDERGSTPDTGAGDDGATSSTAAAGRGWLDGRDWEDFGTSGGSGPSATTAVDAGGEMLADAEASDRADGAGSDIHATTVPSTGATPDTTVSDVGLRAGSVDDNAEFADYLAYQEAFATFGVAALPYDVTERHVITVRDTSGRPVLDATVSVQVAGTELVALRTHADGSVLLFPRALDGFGDAATFDLVVSRGDVTTTAVAERAETVHDVVLDVAAPEGSVGVDVVFLVDTTGSMSDEISRLVDNMGEVAAQLAALGDVDVRYGLTVYRDRGDAYVTRTFDLTADLVAFQGALAGVSADGGGDQPEALEEGLHDAVDLPAWRDGAVRVVVLVADAPPQLGYDDDVDYTVTAAQAAAEGIVVFPVGSSGTDDQAEYVFRQLAQITSGVFVFLTYGPDGQPGDGTTTHVDDYAVLPLDELVVQLVADEVAPQLPGGPVEPGQ
jgi:hypothetical protein